MAGGTPARQTTESNIDGIFPSIADHWFSDRVCDAPIEKRLLRDTPCAFIAVRFGGTGLGAAYIARIKSKRIAIRNSACVFATDIVRTEAIAEGSSGK